MPKRTILIVFIQLIFLAVVSNAQPAATLDRVPILNRIAPDFHLKDAEGRVVSLSDFKGKVLVLDFWATWCVPCQQSFPGIQRAIDHFAGNDQVAFLFIDTREVAPGFKNIVRSQLKKNHYPFHVVFDETGPDGLQNKLYLSYGMAGIPTKFIIDSNGVIRYQLVGYDPKQTEAESAEELINFVERTKAMAN